MFIEKRPTCVSVIGWAWIVLGGMMCVGAIMGIAGSILMRNVNPPAPVITKLFPFLAIAQIALGVTAHVSGIHFFKLKAWSRPILEGFTWFLLIYVVGLMIVMEYMWITIEPAPNEPDGFKWLGAGISLVVSFLYMIPLVIMLRYLRGDRIRRALSGRCQP